MTGIVIVIRNYILPKCVEIINVRMIDRQKDRTNDEMK